MKVLDRVRAVVADALYLDVEEVQRDSHLMKDLGAESIDFLDIIFRLEKEFSIKLPKGDIEKKARGGLTDEQFAVDGKLTPAAIASIKVAMPEVSHSELNRSLLVRDIPSLFTVATFERMVSEQLFGTAGSEGDATAQADATPASRV